MDRDTGKTGAEPLPDAKRRGLALLNDGQLQQAAELFSLLSQASPTDAEVWYLRGLAYGKLGEIEQAGECGRRAVELRPDYIEAHIVLAKSLLFQGRHDDALRQYQTALDIDPRHARVHNDIAYLHVVRGDHEAAQASYLKAVELNPGFAEAHYDLGNLMRLQERHEEAVEQYRQALRLDPRFAAAHNNLGAALYAQGEVEGNQDHMLRGIEHIRHALELDPNCAEAYNNLAGLLGGQGKHTEAASMAERALALKPDLTEARITLAETRVRQGRADAAVTLLREVLRQQPGRSDIFSSMLMYMQYLPEYSADELFEAAGEWGRRYALMPSPPVPVIADDDPDRPLRVGYVSGDFRNHPVGYFIEQVLTHHDRTRYEVFCYTNGDKRDETTRRLQGLANAWLPIARCADEEVVNQIRRDQIDILVDLSGHTAKNRLPVFARRPAPVQVTWLGYFATTGLPAMDYILGDRYVIPPGEERDYVEEVMRLPDSYLCFSPPVQDVSVSSLPALTRGYVTFGCFHNPAKVTPQVVACWAALLRAVPGAQLYFKYGAFGDAGVQQRYLDQFAEHGIGRRSLRFAGNSPRAEYLAAYREVDIGLDPFPFNGCTITMESLWMGVPAVTRRAGRYVGHMGETILKHLGLAECVTDSEDTYIARAAALASNLPRLAGLRSTLRGRLLKSPLCDGPAFTHHLEAAYRRMWHSRCASQAPPR